MSGRLEPPSQEPHKRLTGIGVVKGNDIQWKLKRQGRDFQDTEVHEFQDRPWQDYLVGTDGVAAPRFVPVWTPKFKDHLKRLSFHTSAFETADDALRCFFFLPD
jgi:hypothetical protein